MKQLVLAAMLAAPLVSIAQKLPQPSPSGKVEQVVGLTTVKVDYSRPSTKGRKIFGDLVPFGEIWRLGANKCTTIEFDGEVTIEGQAVKPGKYSLFAMPSEEVWTVFLNSNTELWGADERKPTEDVLIVKVPRQKMISPVETFTIGFEAVKDDKALLRIQWETTMIDVKLTADATAQGLANIKEALAKPDATFGAYHSSARFCVDRNIDLPQALVWAEKSVSMEKKYWNTHMLALARAANGKYKEAIEAAEMSMALAQTEKDENYVKMNKAKIEEWRMKK